MARLFLLFAGLLPLLGQAASPNLVYILADDLGYGDVRALNPERGKIATPHLDRLAAEGMTFTDAHSGSSVCTPTRYGILTGRYAWRTRLQSGVLSHYAEPLIAKDRLTVPALLKQKGYHTACIGKWHLGFTIRSEDKAASPHEAQSDGAPVGSVTDDGPMTRGFDAFIGFHHARMMKSLFHGNRVTERVEPVDMLPRLVTEASTYIRERAKGAQPFFLYLPLSSPHTPIVPSASWKGKSGLGDYADFVMQTDSAVGEVLTVLEEMKIARETLVIFTSDNGCSPAAGTRKLEKQGHQASGPFRGYKADIWEGGHRVPFFVRWPARIKAGSQCAETVCLTDLMATCADLLNHTLGENAGEDSVSLLPAFLGEPYASPSVIHHSIQGCFSIRQGQWKLCLCPGSGGWGKPGDLEAANKGFPDVQLYDLSTDRAESKNLSEKYPEIVEDLKQRLQSVIKKGRSTPGKPQQNDAVISMIKKNRAAKIKE